MSLLTVRTIFGLGFVLVLASAVNAAEPVTLTLVGGDEACENAVVETTLPASMTDHDHFSLIRIDSGKRIPVQVDRHHREPKLVWIVRDTLDAGARREYRLTPASEPLASHRVSVTDDGKRLLVQVGAKPVLSYNHASVPATDLEHPEDARSGYIHPLYNPSGEVVTDDLNPHHPHHHGVMLAWRKMTFQGRQTNGWEQRAKLGRIEHSELADEGGGPVFGFFQTRLTHLDLTAPDGPVPALDETWYVRVYAFEDGFQFDLTSTQACASDKPVSIDKMHYGGMTIRGRADWLEHGDFRFLTSEGKSKLDGNQTRPRWVDLSGRIGEQVSGTLILDHPNNFRFPQPVRLHPSLPYFCFTPASLDSFTIQPGTPFVSRYRFYVHDGPLDVKMANRLWHQYSQAPQIQVAKINE